jgi:hypothetical protein
MIFHKLFLPVGIVMESCRLSRPGSGIAPHMFARILAEVFCHVVQLLYQMP